ncbi:hypothetical protein RQM65_06205 [Pricia sp. S334]|uniref:Uncharacterized protein n=1 Tax=Pricia mediterranea TaxID=3076079 RepID=A0ABU3L3C9_9FLAO|nr:hypothetical protein [Pricia sp. S334]MDT7828250.1 hypothetical protein [Pricia sp. S334]
MRSFIKDPQSTCCDDNGGNGDPGSKTCLEKWRDDLETVCDRYSVEAAETAKHKEAYDNSLNWESKLKNWCTLIETTDDKVKAVIQELDFLLEQLKTVCVKSKCTYEVLQKLTCLVKTIFDSFQTYDDNDQGLKKKILYFKELINCLKHIGENDKAEVIACIEAYEAKITAICDLQKEVLDKLLETLKCADLLWAYLCGELGLEYKLEGIRDILNGETTFGEDDDCEPGEEGEVTEPQYPCDHKAAKPQPEFPIREETDDLDTISGNTYYVKIKGEFKEAEGQTKALKDLWVESKKTSDKSLSEKNSLTDAIAAAEALETGK